MKKIFPLLLAAFVIAFFTGSRSYATNYPFSVSASATAITATMTGVTDTTSEFELYNESNPVPPNDPASSVIKKAVGGSITWTITGTAFKNNTTYYLHVMKLPQAQGSAFNPSMNFPESVTATIPIVTGTAAQVLFYTWPTVSNATGQTALISGKIDTTKYPQVGNLKIELFLSLTDDFSNANHEGPAHDAPTGGNAGVASDGSYYWNITGLTPSTTYYIQQVISSGNTIIDTHSDKFNSSSGYIPAGSAQAQQNFNDQSYHLLAPWPGLSVLMDPGLCAQQQKLTPGAICDINGFLNFAFKTLIGLTAVVLVLRLMFEGYQYMVTDVPFLKASAKSGFMSALFGLLLALSAYIILNTINPKLVSNTIAIANVDVGIEPGNDGLGTESESTTGQQVTLKATSGSPIIITACDASKMVQVNAFGTSFKIERDLLPSVQRIDAKWRQLNPSYKIPMTVSDQKSMGGYVCRNIAGKRKLSYHAYGLAIDINPSSNPQGSALKTDMPQSFINLWKAEGWGWGGDWTSSKDAMHFSKGVNEGGNMTAN